jgi:hypothetical protein
MSSAPEIAVFNQPPHTSQGAANTSTAASDRPTATALLMGISSHTPSADNNTFGVALEYSEH